MANAKKCDRCGVLYEIYNGIKIERGGNSFNWLRLFTTHGVAYREFELCPECMTKLVGFLKGEEVSND